MPIDMDRNRPLTLEEVDDLEQQIERLRALYDLYFQGIEKLEPVQVRKNVFRIVMKVNPSLINNTGLRFRLRNLVQRFNVYQSYWNRIAMQIEAGTFQRDRLKAKRRATQKQEEEQPRHARPGLRARRLRRLLEARGELPEEGSSAAPAEQEQSNPPAIPIAPAAAERAVAAPAPPTPVVSHRADSTPPNLQERYQQVYLELMLQRQACNQGVEGMGYEQVAQRLEATRNKLMASSGCREVEFKVVVEEGKAKLKAIPKQG